jgi:hypothetical protein
MDMAGNDLNYIGCNIEEGRLPVPSEFLPFTVGKASGSNREDRTA